MRGDTDLDFTPSEVDQPAATHEGRRALLAKAVAAVEGVEESAALSLLSDNEARWSGLSEVVPLYDPEALLRVNEMTPHLQPCVDAITQNVDGWGHQSVERAPWMRALDSSDAVAAIEQAVAVEAWAVAEDEESAERAESAHLQRRIARTPRKRDQRRLKKKLAEITAAPTPAADADPTDEVRAIQEELTQQLARERAVFAAWFEHCCSEMSFVDLRKAVRADQMLIGWGCIEMLRDAVGRLKRLVYLPAHTVRPVDAAGAFVDVEEADDLTVLSQGRTVTVRRRFHIYVQIVGGDKVYFKEPRDPHVVSRATGNAYESLEDLRRSPDDKDRPGEGPEAQPANEILWLARRDPRTPCPPPVWIGNLIPNLGVREADHTNYYYLQGNAIPAGLLMVYGGTLKADDLLRLEQRWKAQLKGAKGAGRIIVMEAIPSDNVAPGERTNAPGMKYQSLRESHTNDATFTAYDVRTADRTGASFRLPALLRGYTTNNLNRATAYAALTFAEQQVFSPLREAFDWVINKIILPEIGVRLLRFRSNTPPTRTPEEVATLVQALAPHGGLVPDEVRALAADVLNQPLQDLDADWTTRPIALTLAGITDDGAPAPNDVAQLNEHMRTIEARVGHLMTEEFRNLGLDGYQVRAHVSPPETDEDNEGSNGER